MLRVTDISLHHSPLVIALLNPGFHQLSCEVLGMRSIPKAISLAVRTSLDPAP